MTILCLDDDPARHAAMVAAAPGNVVHCYTIDQFIDALFSPVYPSFDAVSLDHDLNDFESVSRYNDHEATGLDACGLMCGNLAFRAKLPPIIHIHSVNPRGARAMADFLTARGFEVRLVPFNESGMAPVERKTSKP